MKKFEKSKKFMTFAFYVKILPCGHRWVTKQI